MVCKCACGIGIIPKLFLSLFSQVELSHFFRCVYYQSEWIVGTSCAQDLLQFHYANMSMLYTAIFNGCKNDNFQITIFIVFLFLLKT